MPSSRSQAEIAEDEFKTETRWESEAGMYSFWLKSCARRWARMALILLARRREYRTRCERMGREGRSEEERIVNFAIRAQVDFASVCSPCSPAPAQRVKEKTMAVQDTSLPVASTSKSSSTTFSALGVEPFLVKALEVMSIRRPTEVQAACIPPILAGTSSLFRGSTLPSPARPSGSEMRVAQSPPMAGKLIHKEYAQAQTVLAVLRRVQERLLPLQSRYFRRSPRTLMDSLP